MKKYQMKIIKSGNNFTEFLRLSDIYLCIILYNLIIKNIQVIINDYVYFYMNGTKKE